VELAPARMVGSLWTTKRRQASVTLTQRPEFVPLDPKDQGLEYIVMGLRLKSGLSKARLTTYLGKEFHVDGLTDLENAGLIKIDKDHIRATDDGRLVLNKLAEALLPD